MRTERVIQVFEGSEDMSLKNTHTRLTGHPMEIALSPDMLGRTFNGDRARPSMTWAQIVSDTEKRRERPSLESGQRGNIRGTISIPVSQLLTD